MADIDAHTDDNMRGVYHYFEELTNGMCKSCDMPQNYSYHAHEFSQSTERPFERLCHHCGEKRGAFVHNQQLRKDIDSIVHSGNLHHPRISVHNEPGARETIAEEASRIVYGDREKAYDSPNRNFRKLSHMWTGTILEKLKEGEVITATDVALMLIQLKISRESFMPNRENRVDGIGYWLCEDRVATEDTQPPGGGNAAK